MHVQQHHFQMGSALEDATSNPWQPRSKAGRLLVCISSAGFVAMWQSLAPQGPPVQVLPAFAGVTWIIFFATTGLIVVLVAVVFSCWVGAHRRRQPFEWVVTSDCSSEFVIGGRMRNTVEKLGDYRTPGWVIPVNGTIEMTTGNLYSWSLVFEQVSRDRPQMQFGIQGVRFEHPWRLITTTKCSRSTDEHDEWIPRPGGERLIKEHDTVHLELDLRFIPGQLRMAINDEPFELVFDDIPVGRPIMPAVMLGGNGSRVRVQATRRSSGRAA